MYLKGAKVTAPVPIRPCPSLEVRTQRELKRSRQTKRVALPAICDVLVTKVETGAQGIPPLVIFRYGGAQYSFHPSPGSHEDILYAIKKGWTGSVRAEYTRMVGHPTTLEELKIIEGSQGGKILHSRPLNTEYP